MTANELRKLIEGELARIQDTRVLECIRQHLVEPVALQRAWDYGAPGQTYPCWSVLDHVPSNTRICYCTPPGTRVCVSAVADAAFLRVTVDDDGPGLPL
jgi:hypothetical protein